MSAQRAQPPRRCPVPNCTWTVPALTTRPHASLKEHIIATHKESKPTDYMPPSYRAKHGYHLCTKCDTTDTIYTSQGHLQKHITTKHSRKNTNLQLVFNTYRHASTDTQTNWKRSFEFLHTLAPTPPPFRRTTWHQLKAPARKEYFHTVHTIANWTLEATPELHTSILKDDNPPQWNIDPRGFWKLLLLAEPLLLAPHQEHGTPIVLRRPQNTASTVQNRPHQRTVRHSLEPTATPSEEPEANQEKTTTRTKTATMGNTGNNRPPTNNHPSSTASC